MEWFHGGMIMDCAMIGVYVAIGLALVVFCAGMWTRDEEEGE